MLSYLSCYRFGHRSASTRLSRPLVSVNSLVSGTSAATSPSPRNILIIRSVKVGGFICFSEIVRLMPLSLVNVYLGHLAHEKPCIRVHAFYPIKIYGAQFGEGSESSVHFVLIAFYFVDDYLTRTGHGNKFPICWWGALQAHMCKPEKNLRSIQENVSYNIRFHLFRSI